MSRRNARQLAVTVAASSATIAVTASLLAGATPAASAADEPSKSTTAATTAPAAGSIAGIETAGPLPIVSASGPRLPVLPPALAVVPGGTALSADSPWLSIPKLARDGAPSEVIARVYDASLGFGGTEPGSDRTWTWQGTLTRGWGRITERLTPGHGYVVWARDPGGSRWINLGGFDVRGTVDAAGPTTEVGSMTVALATGEVSWTWESAALPGPVEGVTAALRWQARQSAGPGLPAGWRLAIATGSPWASLEEARPAAPRATTRRDVRPHSDVACDLTHVGQSPEAVTLRDWDGSAITFERNSSGVYDQVFGGRSIAGYRNTLARCGATWHFTDSSGRLSVFRDGRIVAVKEEGRVLARLSWSGDRLTTVTNGVGREITFTYAGSGACPTWAGFATTPSGMLCRITAPGPAVTEIGYVAGGSGPFIALVKDPGNAGTALGWDSVGRLVATRSTLASRQATVDPRARGAIARVEYDARGRARTLVDAPAAADSTSITRTLEVPVITEQELRRGTEVVATLRGSAPGFDMANTTRLDPLTHAATSMTDRAGLTTSTSVNDERVRTRDGRGLVTAYQQDDAGNLIQQSGPVRAGGAGQHTKATYDTDRRGDRDVAYEGMRATVYARPGFQGSSTAQYWTPQDRSGLSGRWRTSGPMSALAQALWEPTAADDRRAREGGWTFVVDHAPDADVRLMVDGVLCDRPRCRIDDLPKGIKQVTVEVRRGASSGWFDVRVGAGSATPAPLPTSTIRPGFNNRTVIENNDTFVNSSARPSTYLDYARPQDGLVTSVRSPGGFTSTLAYEQSGWQRLTTYRTPGGRSQQYRYQPDTGTVTLPAPCTGTGQAFGQVRSVVRPDGTEVLSYQDAQGRTIASRTQGLRTHETVCTTYDDDGTPRRVSVFATDGRLIESVETRQFVNGDPLTSAQVITRGPAAPFGAGTVSVATTTTDLNGAPVRYIDASGTTTTTRYSPLGDPVDVQVTPPGQARPLLALSYSYRSSDGALIGVSANGVPMAQVDYAGGTGVVNTISYARNAVRAALTYSPDGRPDVLVVTGDGLRVTQRLERTDFGRITAERLTATSGGATLLTETRGHTYDVAGRLVRSQVTSTTDITSRADYRYTYGARSNASCGAAMAQPGADSVRTGGTRGNVSYVTCHDAAGRPTSSTDPLLTLDPDGRAQARFAHDGLGRVTSISGTARPLDMVWASGTTLAEVTEGTGPERVRTTMLTGAGRVLDRTVESAVSTARAIYAYTAPDATTPVLALDGSGAVSSLSYPLPGSARVTVQRGEVATVDIAGLDGAALASIAVPGAAIEGVSGSGGPGTSLAERFGPYGEPLTTPTAITPTFGWQAAQGQVTLPGVASITLMGARPYLPATGEFLAPDPDLEASTNLYGYAAADPVNGSDPTGASNGWSWFWQIVTAVLVVAAVIINVATLGKATPATGAGLVAWMGYLGKSIGVPMVTSYLAGKAAEQSLLTQTEPSSGLDTLRAVLGWTEMVSSIAMVAIPVVTLGAAAVTKVASWWRAKGTVARHASTSVVTALTGARVDSTALELSRITLGDIGNGGRDALARTTGRLGNSSAFAVDAYTRLSAPLPGVPSLLAAVP